MNSGFKSFLLITLGICFLVCNAETGSLCSVKKNHSLNTSLLVKWRLVSSPIKNSLSKIHMLSKSRGYISGKFLLEYDGKRWSLSKNQPPVHIDFLFHSNDNRIWVSSESSTYESLLYELTGKEWKRIYHPLINQVASLFAADDGKIWVGGDREIGYYEKNKKEIIPYPPDLYAAINISGKGKELWVNTYDQKLFNLKNGSWEEALPGEPVRFFLLENEKHLYALSNEKIFEFKNSRWILHSKDTCLNDILKFTVSADGALWAIGKKGLVLHYCSGIWEKVNVPSTEDLQDIKMLSESDGWIVGNNGLILHYTDITGPEIDSAADFGFDSRRVYRIGKETNDEYGVAIDDINGDGLKDIYAVCLYEPSRLYINKMKDVEPNSLLFYEEAAPRGINGLTGNPYNNNLTEIYMGIGLADIDNDGDPDLYLCDLANKNKLFLNNGNGYFRNVSDQDSRGTVESRRTNGAVFADVDNDGDLDMFVTNEYGSNSLFLNDGSGYFKDITRESGLFSGGGGMSACFSDINGDGRPDLYVANWGKQNKLYLNISSGKNRIGFKDITDWSGTGGLSFSKSNAVCFADIDNDGDQDLFVTNRKSSNRLYKNDGSGKFSDITEEYIGTDTMLSYGASFADFNNDGWLDLFIANVGENQLYKNIGGKKFISVTSEVGGLDKGYFTGTATGDIDNDGDVDLYASCYTGSSSVLFLNNINNRNFLELNIEGTLSNRDAVGVKVWLFESGHAGDIKYLKGYREINSGSGYVSHSSREIHFGVNYGSFYDIIIYFPSSSVKKVLHNVNAGQRLSVREEEGYKALATLSLKAFLRFVTDPEVHRDTVKIIVVIIMLFASVSRGKKKYNWKVKNLIIYHSVIFFIFLLQEKIFYGEKLFFSDLLPLSSVLIMILVLHLTYERIILVRISKQERQATRDRIARDLHDDLASTISTSIIYAQILKSSIGDKYDKKHDLIEKINRLLGEASETITDIVWTVSPKYDKLSDLIVRVNSIISDVCRTREIEYIFENNIAAGKDYIISAEFKRNVLLIFKEALNNSSKYSSAQKIEFSAALDDGILELRFQDNGTGFSIGEETEVPGRPGLLPGTNQYHGNGLHNMTQRAAEIDGNLLIDSDTGKGTAVIFRKKMT